MEVVQTVVLDEDRDKKLLKVFMRYKPSLFRRKLDPLMAEDWMLKTEMILNTIRAQHDEDQIRLATYSFESDADQRWRDKKETVDLTGITWEGFRSCSLTSTLPY